MDLKVTNNVLHIRTCADACSSLTKLLLYLANDGDMKGPPQYVEEQSEEHVVSWDMKVTKTFNF